MTEERPFIDKALGWQIGFLPRFLYQPLSECCLSLTYIEKLFKIPPYTYRTYFMGQILTLNWPYNQMFTYPLPPGKASQIHQSVHS